MRRTALTVGDRVRVGRASRSHRTSWTQEAVIVSTDRELTKAVKTQRMEERLALRGATSSYRQREGIDTVEIAVAVPHSEEGWVGRFVPAREILFTQEEYEVEEARKAAATVRYEAHVATEKLKNEPIIKALNEFLGADEIFGMMDNGAIGMQQEGVGMDSPGYVRGIPWEARPIVNALLDGLGLKEDK